MTEIIKKLDVSKDGTIDTQELHNALTGGFFDNEENVKILVESLNTTKDEELIRSISSTFGIFLNSPENHQYVQEISKTHPELISAIQKQISPEQINIIEQLANKEKTDESTIQYIQSILQKKDVIIQGKESIIGLATDFGNEQIKNTLLNQALPYFLSTLSGPEYTSFLKVLKPNRATIERVVNTTKKGEKSRKSDFLKQYLASNQKNIPQNLPEFNEKTSTYVYPQNSYTPILEKIGIESAPLDPEFVKIIKENHLWGADMKLIQTIFQKVQNKDAIMKSLHKALDAHNKKNNTHGIDPKNNPYGIKDYSNQTDALNPKRTEAELIKSGYGSRRCKEIDDINTKYIEAIRTIPKNKRTIKETQESTVNGVIPFTGQQINLNNLKNGDPVSSVLVDTTREAIKLGVTNFGKARGDKNRSVVGQQVGSLVGGTAAVALSALGTQGTSLTQSALIFSAGSKVGGMVGSMGGALAEGEGVKTAFTTMKKETLGMDQQGNINWLKVGADSAFDFTSAFLTFGIGNKIPGFNTLFASQSKNALKQFGAKSLQFGFEELAIESFLVDMPMNSIQTGVYAYTGISGGEAIVGQTALGTKTVNTENSSGSSESLKGDLWGSMLAGIDARDKNTSAENITQTIVSTLAYGGMLEAGRWGVGKLHGIVSDQGYNKLQSIEGEYHQGVAILTKNLETAGIRLEQSGETFQLRDKNGQIIDQKIYLDIGIGKDIEHLATIGKSYIDQVQAIKAELATNPEKSRLMSMIQKYKVTGVFFSIEESFKRKLATIEQQLISKTLKESEKQTLMVMKGELERVANLLENNNNSFNLSDATNNNNEIIIEKKEETILSSQLFDTQKNINSVQNIENELLLELDGLPETIGIQSGVLNKSYVDGYVNHIKNLESQIKTESDLKKKSELQIDLIYQHINIIKQVQGSGSKGFTPKFAKEYLELDCSLGSRSLKQKLDAANLGDINVEFGMPYGHVVSIITLADGRKIYADAQNGYLGEINIKLEFGAKENGYASDFFTISDFTLIEGKDHDGNKITIREGQKYVIPKYLGISNNGLQNTIGNIHSSVSKKDNKTLTPLINKIRGGKVVQDIYKEKGLTVKNIAEYLNEISDQQREEYGLEKKYIGNNETKDIQPDSHILLEALTQENQNTFVKNNRDVFLEQIKLDKRIKLKCDINTLISKIKEVDDSPVILKNIIEINDKSFDLRVRTNSGDIQIEVISKNTLFHTNRAHAEVVVSERAGWVAQGDFSMIDGDGNVNYSSHDHWGIAIAEELQGSGLASFLYNLKSLVNNQPKYEHVGESNYSFLMFYIKKGYVPYAKLEFDEKSNAHPVELTQNEINFIIHTLTEQKYGKNNASTQNEDRTLKLKFDPEEATKIYRSISQVEEKISSKKNQYNFPESLQTENSLNSDNLIIDGVINPDAVSHLETFLRVQNVLGANESLNEDQIKKIYEVHNMQRNEGETDDVQLNIRKGLALRKFGFSKEQVRIMMEGKVCGESENKSYFATLDVQTSKEMHKIFKELYPNLSLSEKEFERLINILELSDISEINESTEYLWDNNERMRFFIKYCQYIEDTGIFISTNFIKDYFPHNEGDIKEIEKYKQHIQTLKQSKIQIRLQDLQYIKNNKNIIDIALKYTALGIGNGNISDIPTDEKKLEIIYKLKDLGVAISLDELKYINNDFLEVYEEQLKVIQKNSQNFREKGITLLISDIKNIIDDKKKINNVIILKEAGINLSFLNYLSIDNSNINTVIRCKNAGIVHYLGNIENIFFEDKKKINNAIKIAKAGMGGLMGITFSDIQNITDDQQKIDNAIKLHKAGISISFSDIQNISDDHQKIDNAIKLHKAGIYIKFKDIQNIIDDQQKIDNAIKLHKAGIRINFSDIHNIPEANIVKIAIKYWPYFITAGLIVTGENIKNIPTNENILKLIKMHGYELNELGFKLTLEEIKDENKLQSAIDEKDKIKKITIKDRKSKIDQKDYSEWVKTINNGINNIIEDLQYIDKGYLGFSNLDNKITNNEYYFKLSNQEYEMIADIIGLLKTQKTVDSVSIDIIKLFLCLNGIGRKMLYSKYLKNDNNHLQSSSDINNYIKNNNQTIYSEINGETLIHLNKIKIREKKRIIGELVKENPGKTNKELLLEFNLANENIKKIILNSSSYISVRGKYLGSILTKGLKTQFEKNSSGGVLDQSLRKKREKEMFGSDFKYNNHNRPRYGFLYDQNPLQCLGIKLSGYGDCGIKLKQKTLFNTTFTGVDSLNDKMVPSLLGDKDILISMFNVTLYKDFKGNYAKMLNYFQNANSIDDLISIMSASRLNFTRYIEIQHHGDISINDIESIYIPKGFDLDQKIIDICKDNNIKILTD